MLSQPIDQHPEGCGFSAATHAGKNFYKRRISIGHDFFGIKRSFNHSHPFHDSTVPQLKKIKQFFWLYSQNFSFWFQIAISLQKGLCKTGHSDRMIHRVICDAVVFDLIGEKAK